MKREADGSEMGSPNKRFRRGDEEVRLLIPSKVAGSIIGKGGQNITKLRSQYKASITVPDCPGPERMLTLSSDLDTICHIISDVVPNLEDNGSRINGNDLDLRMMIHQSQAGCVIGRGGQKIKELRDKTGARIKIFSSCAPQSTDRIIQIIGQPQKCIHAIREVICLIKTSPIKGPVNPYDPHNYDDFYAEEYGGYGGGGGGGVVGGTPDNRRGPSGPPQRGGPPPPPPPARTNPSGGRYNRGPPMPPSRSGMNNYNDRSMGGPPSRGYGGPPRAVNGGNGSFERSSPWAPMNGGNNLMSQHSPPSILPSQGNSGMSGGHSGGPGSGGSGGPGKSSTQVTIPKDLAGAIIGKGGGRIRKIRQDSGAGITIDEPLPGSNDRIITITGLPNQIQMAQYLLQQSVHNNADRHNY